MSSAIDVVIVNWNAGSQLRDCVDSALTQSEGLVRTCIVVDNASTDGSTDFLENREDVLLEKQQANLGFSRACNLGSSRCGSKYILFLNPDACVLEGTLKGIHDFLEDPQNSRVAVVGPKLVGEGGQAQRTCSTFPTLGNFLFKSFGLASIFPSLDFQMKYWAHDRSRKVDQIIGAFFVVRRDVFERLGGFDERFFVYFEELDFSLRMSHQGYSSFYLTEVVSFHKGGGVTDQVKAHRLFYSNRSRILYAFKHFSIVSSIIVVISTLAVEFFTRLAMLLLKFRFTEIADLVSAYKMLWCWALTSVKSKKPLNQIS